MDARSILLGWDVPADERQSVIARLLGVVNDPLSSPRDITTAAKGLMGVPALELAALKHELNERIAAARLAENQPDAAGSSEPRFNIPEVDDRSPEVDASGREAEAGD